MEFLPADATVELSDSGLPVEFDRDGLFVIAEQAGERGGKRIGLVIRGVSIGAQEHLDGELAVDAPFWAPLAFSMTPFVCPWLFVALLVCA